LTSGVLGFTKPEPFLRVSALRVEYCAADGDVVRALHGFDLDLGEGESVGILGESGSGKSSLALALLRLLPRNARVTAGTIEYRGRNLADLSPTELRSMRGGEVALISQEPALALNPVLPLGRQLADVLVAHRSLDSQAVAGRCQQVVREVGFDAPERILRAGLPAQVIDCR
jgi:ABC-type glutathione transport system ATPase component